MERNKILIVSYKLGTKHGVGGRRWLYYGLGLLKRGHDVFFLTYEAELPAELKDYKDRVVFLKTNYPKVLKSQPKSLINKLLYRFWVFILSRLNNGAIFDEAVRTKQQFIDKASQLIIQKKIQYVLISGAPFSLLHFGTLLKKRFPQITLISDYRDAWTQGIGYGIQQLPSQKFQNELNNEKEVLMISDKIFVASNDIGNSLNEIVDDIKPIAISNFIDNSHFANDVLNTFKTEEKESNTITISHIGSVNKGLQKYWIHFLKNINEVHKTGIFKIKCQFIGCQNKELKEYAQSNDFEFVYFLPNMDVKEFGKYLLNSDMLVFFKHDDFPNSFPTKFFDYVLFKKPLLCYSVKGDVTEEIISNTIGTIFDENVSYENFLKTIMGYKNGSLKFNDNYDWSKFSLENCISRIEDTLHLKKN